MLIRVTIENFILIKDLEIEFTEGLNVISGETGTGKSMTMSAIEFVMGKQGDYPEGTAVEIEVLKDRSAVILRREIRGERSRYFLDGRGTSAKTVREILEESISIQGQNEFIRLLKGEFQRELLDKFSGNEELLSRFTELYSEFMGLKKKLEELSARREEIVQRKEFLEFKLREIEEIGLSEEEVEELREKANNLKNMEKINRLIREAIYGLYEGDSSAYTGVGNALRSLWKLSELGVNVSEEIDRLNVVKESLMEISQSLQDKDFELSQEEIDRINDLLFKVQRLEKKYNKGYGEILRETERLKEELSQASGYDELIEELSFEVNALKKNLTELAKELNSRRKSGAKRLEKEIESVLRELNMERAKLKVNVERGELGKHGFDRVEFLFSSYGSELKPIDKSASGGELSRLFLALSLIRPPAGTYIFDEVDVGVSGNTSVKLARLLKKVARNMQVIAITHSAPVCAAGDTNFVTEKAYIGDIPYIRLRKVEGEEKLREVARLMGTATENTIKGAKELLELVRS